MASRILRLLALALTLSATVRGEPPAKSVVDGEALSSLAALVAKDLRGATTIVIAESKEPEGAIIREIIRGNALELKVGEQWKDDFPTTFPPGPILIWRTTGDIIGKLPAIPSVTHHSQLDETKRFIVFNSSNHANGKKEKILLPLAWVLERLKAP